MRELQRTHSPIDGELYVERPLADAPSVAAAVPAARRAQAEWSAVPVAERAVLCERALAHVLAHGDEIALELTRQMGRPIAHSPGELRGFEERARHMIAIAPEALADVQVDPLPGFTRFIRREPLGVVLTVAPWNYPWLTAVNSSVPALLAGNAVLLKHSAQTPLVAERLADAFEAAGAPPGLFAYLHCTHRDIAELIERHGVDFVAFTGSVEGGHAIQRAAAERFIGAGLELGGKDPAYVRADADVAVAVEGIVDGAFFNAGQSCCGIERVYVHPSVYDGFVDGALEAVRRYRLGNPLEPETTLGPMVRASAAEHVRGQIREAVDQGARALIDPAEFPADAPARPISRPSFWSTFTTACA